MNMGRFKKLLVEIHQRSVWQALAVYLGASYAVLEAAAYFRDEFGLPDWLPPVALVLLLIGLPVVVLTSLAREEVYGGKVPAGDAEAAAEEDRRLRLLTWRTAGLSFLGALALWGVIAAGLLLTGTYGRVAADERPSIAVLPFENVSPDPDNAYFADGIHEETISQLSKIATLKVISRTSVMGYRERVANLRTIADELGVTHVLEGTVRRAGNDVRITTQLIAARDDAHLWAETYDRPLTVENLLGVQSEVALRVAEALKAVLTAEEAELIERRPTDNLEAYEFYLRAQAYKGTGLNPSSSGREWRTSQQLLERSIELDPDFALAQVSLSRVHLLLYRNWDPTPERLSAGKLAIDRALDVDPEMPEVYVALGEYYYSGLRDWDRALEALRKAESKLGAGEEVYRWLGLTYRRLGRLEEAAVYLERQVEYDPLNAAAWMNLGTTYTYLLRYLEAEKAFDRAIALHPEFGTYYLYKAWIYLTWRGDEERARQILDEYCSYSSQPLPTFTEWIGLAGYRILREHYEEAVLSQTSESLGWRKDQYFALMGLAYGMAGQADKSRVYYDSARVFLETIIASSPETPRYHSYLAIANAGLGRMAEAIQEAETAVRLGRGSFTNRDYWAATLAQVYVMVGEQEMAIEQLDQLLSRGSDSVTPMELRLDPLWDPLRDHPRFQALLEKYQ